MMLEMCGPHEEEAGDDGRDPALWGLLSEEGIEKGKIALEAIRSVSAFSFHAVHYLIVGF
jgi:hypothetical protein